MTVTIDQFFDAMLIPAGAAWLITVVCVATFIISQRRRDSVRAGATVAYGDELHRIRVALAGEVIDVNGVPVVIGRSPKLEPDYEPAAAAEPIVLRITRPPATTHRSDETATTSPGYQPRHLGHCDPRLRALIETTDVFEELAESVTGTRPREHGPRESDLQPRRLVWLDDEWTQAELDLGVTR